MKDTSMERREFLRASAAIAAGAGIASAGQPGEAAPEPSRAVLPKAVVLGMVPEELTDEEKFKLLRSCGFDGVEARPVEGVDAARRQAETARAAGITIHSVMFGGWHAPFSHPDPAKIDEGLRGMENALRCAKAMGATTVLLVPAVVNAQVRYADAYERSQRHIRKLLPLAEELGVIIAVENVWNNFLLSPLEFARYVDEFESPWLRAYFDVGNIVKYGWPEDWIRTLGERIVKVHLKDFKRDGQQWMPLREGDVNWPEVRRAFAEVGYSGFLTAELPGGDEAYLRDVAARIDKIVAGE